MAAAYVAGSLIGNGQTATTASVSATVPAAAAAGQVAIVSLVADAASGGFEPPAGWTWVAGPRRRLSAPYSTTQVFAKTLVAGEPGSSVTFTYSSVRRIVGTVSVFSGVGLPDPATVAWLGESSSTLATLPVTSGVPAGTVLFAVYGRATPGSGVASFTSTPAGWTAGVQSKTNYSSASNLLARNVYRVVTSPGTYGGDTATTDVSTSGVNAMVALPPTSNAGAAEVFGATALVSAASSGGGAGAPQAVSVTGVTALVVAEGGVKVPPPLPAPGQWPPAPYREAIRSAVAIWYTVDALSGGVPVAGATDLAPTGGTITDTTKPGVRRVLSLELAPSPGLFDLLSPSGTQLRVTAHIRYTSRDVLDLPMGVFVIDSEKLSEGGGGISLTAPDKWSLIQRARLMLPESSYPGISVSDQITRLIRGALGQGEVVNNYATSGAIMGAQTWEKDRDKAIIDLAKAAAVWVFFDRDGVATITDLPTTGASADWLVDASATGVMTSLDRERSRANTYNVVVVSSSAADGEAFPTQIVWDDDPASPTYAGTNPVLSAGTAGPFGIVPYFFDTPLPLEMSGARQTGRAILARVSGLASQVSLGQVPNPAVDAFDIIDVMPPRQRYDQPRFLERHVVDTVTHPLTMEGDQHIEGRSTRADEIEGGS